MGFGIYKKLYNTDNKIILISDEYLKDYLLDCYFGIDLVELLDYNKPFFITVTDECLAQNYDELEDETEILFDENVKRYIEAVLKHREEIIERASLYDKEKEYTQLLNEVYEKYSILVEE